MLGKLIEKYHDHAYLVFRVFVGLLFFQHGAQKVFGLFGGTATDLMSLMGVAGVIELVAGLFIAVGLFTRPLALISALEMLAAYFMMHFPNGLVPIENKGELALLYFAAFLIITTHGSKKWGLEQAVLKKEHF